MRRAFTLIELLVVMAILAILAAILFPVFAASKDAAKTAVCLSHMRQVGLALQLYADDADEFWAPAMNGTPGRPGDRPQQPWIGYDTSNAGMQALVYGDSRRPASRSPRPGAIDRYLKSHDVKKCPSQPPAWQLALAYNWFSRNLPSAFYDSHPEARGLEYGPGSKDQFRAPMGFATNTTAASSEIQEPANTMVVWEHSSNAPVCNHLQGPDWLDAPPQSPATHLHYHAPHRGRMVTIWADGHAKAMRYAELKRPMMSVRKDLYR